MVLWKHHRGWKNCFIDAKVSIFNDGKPCKEKQERRMSRTRVKKTCEECISSSSICKSAPNHVNPIKVNNTDYLVAVQYSAQNMSPNAGIPPSKIILLHTNTNTMREWSKKVDRVQESWHCQHTLGIMEPLREEKPHPDHSSIHCQVPQKNLRSPQLPNRSELLGSSDLSYTRESNTMQYQVYDNSWLVHTI